MLGVIADDFTGASDISLFLKTNGLKTIMLNEIPKEGLVNFPEGVQAIVISLKIRTIEAQDAVTQALAAYDWLKDHGCTQFYYKYCSTFDSTAKGNIGPVTDALMEKIGCRFTLIVPSLPVNARTVYNGNLFVGELPLSESGMANHPLTPMKDSNLVRLMNAQSQGKTGLVAYKEVESGTANLVFNLLECSVAHKYIVVDAINDSNLDTIAEAIKDLELKFVTGGSGLGGAMAKLASGKKVSDRIVYSTADISLGVHKTCILSGSCSKMTNKQVEHYKIRNPDVTLQLDIGLIMLSEDHRKTYVEQLLAWVLKQAPTSEYAPLIYATSPAEQVKELQEKYGADLLAQKIEQTFGDLAVKLRDHGFNHLIIAGGETSSIVVKRLEIGGFQISTQIAPGVPWLKDLSSPVCLALKSGNFGDERFFTEAQDLIRPYENN